MPIALIIIGLLLFLAAYRDQLSSLADLLRGDFTGAGNFIYWIAAFSAIGALGTIKYFRNSSKMLMGLVLVIMIISDKGFFNQFVAAISENDPSKATTAVGNATITDSQATALATGDAIAKQTGVDPATAQTASSSGGLGSLTKIASTVGGVAKDVGVVAALL